MSIKQEVESLQTTMTTETETVTSIRFHDDTEATLWFTVFSSMSKAGASKDYAATQADSSLAAWRERNPSGFLAKEFGKVNS